MTARERVQPLHRSKMALWGKKREYCSEGFYVYRLSGKKETHGRGTTVWNDVGKERSTSAGETLSLGEVHSNL